MYLQKYLQRRWSTTNYNHCNGKSSSSLSTCLESKSFCLIFEYFNQLQVGAKKKEHKNDYENGQKQNGEQHVSSFQ